MHFSSAVLSLLSVGVQKQTELEFAGFCSFSFLFVFVFKFIQKKTKKLGIGIEDIGKLKR